MMNRACTKSIERIALHRTCAKSIERVALYWMLTADGDVRAKQLYERHYSRNPVTLGRPTNLFVGPGQKLVLVTIDYSALFVWRKFISRDTGQVGVNCAVFRNESSVLSSLLILEAERFAWGVWPQERLYTYVNPFKIKSTNPGYCFIKAGWHRTGQVTKVHGLIVLEKLPYEVV